ncbi:hypothetical protein Pat9b_2960 [Pantoea sp. At-9b]|nr:hypothetical protein Pat9b_2960 [Pantoea sp. At-9b]
MRGNHKQENEQRDYYSKYRAKNKITFIIRGMPDERRTLLDIFYRPVH